MHLTCVFCLFLVVVFMRWLHVDELEEKRRIHAVHNIRAYVYVCSMVCVCACVCPRLCELRVAALFCFWLYPSQSTWSASRIENKSLWKIPSEQTGWSTSYFPKIRWHFHWRATLLPTKWLWPVAIFMNIIRFYLSVSHVYLWAPNILLAPVNFSIKRNIYIKSHTHAQSRTYPRWCASIALSAIFIFFACENNYMSSMPRDPLPPHPSPPERKYRGRKNAIRFR